MTTVTSNSITGITTLTATTDVASKEYVDNKPLGTLPSQTGNAGKFLLTTDGTSLSWDYVSNYQEFTTTGIQTFTVPSQSNILLIEAVGAGAGGGAGTPNGFSGWGGPSGSYTSWFIPKSIVTSKITINPGIGGVGAATSGGLGSAGAGTTISWTGPGGTYALTANGAVGLSTTPTTLFSNPGSVSVSISTAVSKFGNGSAFFAPTGNQTSYVQANFTDTVAGDYTMEWWQYRTGTLYGYYGTMEWGVYNNSILNTGVGGWYLSGGSGGVSGNGAGWSNTANTWEHYALVRNGSTVTMYKDGVGTVLTTSGSGIFNPSTDTFRIGAPQWDNGNWAGYMNDFIFYNGVAKYTSNFTPPTTQYNFYADPYYNYVMFAAPFTGTNGSTSIGYFTPSSPGGVGVAQTFTQSSFYYTTAGLSGAVAVASGVGNTATTQTNQFQPTGGGSGAASTTTSTGGPSGSINVYGITASASGGTSSTINGSTGIAYTGLPYGTGGGGGGAGISYDLDNWILRTSGVVDNISSIAYASNSYIFGGANRILGTSTDSISWELRTSGFNNSLTNAILYANSTYVAGDNGGGVNTSTDGIHWILRTSGFGSNAVLSATYANSTFIAAGENGVLNTSTDSVTWTLRTTSLSNIFALTFGNNTYVAAGLVGILNTSTDTIHWTSRTAGFGLNNIRALSYADNTFVAAGVNGRLNTSTDAVTWTLRTAGFVANTIFALTYVTDSYFAAGAGGTLNSSTNGIVWSLRTSNFGATQINSLTFGNNIYLGAGNSGTISVATSGPLTPGKGGKGARGGGGGGGASIGSTFGNGGDGGDGYVKITWW